MLTFVTATRNRYKQTHTSNKNQMTKSYAKTQDKNVLTYLAHCWYNM